MELVNPIAAGSVTPQDLSFVNKFAQTGLTANLALTAWFTPSASGLFIILGQCIVTQAATTSSTLPQFEVTYTDVDSNVAELWFGGTAPTNNTVGLLNNLAQLTGSGMAVAVINAKAGVGIQIATSGYASAGATPMAYALHAIALGPF